MRVQSVGRGSFRFTSRMLSAGLLAFTCLAFTSLALFPVDAKAGRMKDVHMLHLEAVAEYLYGNSDTDGLEYRNSSFVAAEAGFQFAVRSEFLVYSPVTDGFDWVPCVTQLIQTSPRSIRVAKTVCH